MDVLAGNESALLRVTSDWHEGDEGLHAMHEGGGGGGGDGGFGGGDLEVVGFWFFRFGVVF